MYGSRIQFLSILFMALLSGCGFKLIPTNEALKLPTRLNFSAEDPFGTFSKSLRAELQLQGVDIIEEDALYTLRIFGPNESLNSLGPITNGEQMELIKTLSYILERNDNTVAIPLTKVRSERIFVKNTKIGLSAENSQTYDISKQLESDLAEKFLYSLSLRYGNYSSKNED